MITEYFFTLSCLFLTHQILKFIPLLSQSTQYYIIHIIINSIVVIFSWKNLTEIFVSPLRIGISENDNYVTVPSMIVLLLHIYHTIFFQLYKIEYIHHGLMMSLLLYPILNIKYLPMTNSMLFFTSGLPGLLIYSSLVLYKIGLISKETHNYIDRKINLYLRSPGILFTIFIIYIRYIYNIYDDLRIVIIVSTLLFWNAQYFTDLSFRI